MSNFYLHYMGDYARDTRDLTPLEHGCYRLLMDHNYATEKPVPNEPKELYRIVGAATPAERKAVEKIVERFFPLNGDGRRHHKRIEKELSRMKEKSEKAKASAERRWGGKPDADAEPMRTHSAGNANQNQKPEEPKTSDAPHRKAATASQPIPDCPHEKLIALYHELMPTCTRVVDWDGERPKIMRARWRDKAVSKAKNWGYTTEEQGLACWRKFLGWCATSDFLTGKASGRDGGAPFVADLEWLVRPKNFVKVVEGKYHR